MPNGVDLDELERRLALVESRDRYIEEAEDSGDMVHYAASKAFNEAVDDVRECLHLVAPALIASARMLDELVAALPRCGRRECPGVAVLGYTPLTPFFCDEHGEGYGKLVPCRWADIIRRRDAR